MKTTAADAGHARTLNASDLDGALLRGDATLSAFRESVLRELLADGLLFTEASARSVVSMQSSLGDLPLRLPVIEFNRALLSDYATGWHELSTPSSREWWKVFMSTVSAIAWRLLSQCSMA